MDVQSGEAVWVQQVNSGDEKMAQQLRPPAIPPETHLVTSTHS